MLKELIKGFGLITALAVLVIVVMYLAMVKQSITAGIVILIVFASLIMLIPFNALRAIYRFIKR